MNEITVSDLSKILPETATATDLLSYFYNLGAFDGFMGVLCDSKYDFKHRYNNFIEAVNKGYFNQLYDQNESNQQK